MKIFDLINNKPIDEDLFGSTFSPMATIGRKLNPYLHHGEYEKAIQDLENEVEKEKQSGLKKGFEYWASRIARIYSHVDARKLMDFYKELHPDLATETKSSDYKEHKGQRGVAEGTEHNSQDLKDVAQWMNTTPDKLNIVLKQEPIEKFMKQIREMYGTYDEFPEDEDRTNRILKLLKKGSKPLPMYVEADDSDLFVMEGRHRMVALWLAGMKTIPVAYVSVKKQGVAENSSADKITYTQQKGKNKFSIEMLVNGKSAGIFQYDASTGRTITELDPKYRGQGLGQRLILKGIYTAVMLGMDYVEDESKTKMFDRAIDNLADAGYIVNDGEYWYVTNQGEQFLKQSIAENLNELTHIKLSNDPNDLGATVDDEPPYEPTTMIHKSQIVAVFEPDEMHDEKPGAKERIARMVVALKKGRKLPPVLLRKYKNGYQILDGHHRYKAYRVAGTEMIPSRIIPPERIKFVKRKRTSNHDWVEKRSMPKMQENTVSGTTNVYGPYKVTAFDPKTQIVKIDGHEDIKLSARVTDKPRPGFNYAFELKQPDNTAVKLILLTADNVITTGEEVLLIKRKNPPFAGFWALPGGFIDPGESPDQAAKRELEEEAGVKLNVTMKFIGKFSKPGRDPRMNDVWSYAYLAKVSKNTITAGDDASDVQWTPISKLNGLDLAFDHADIIEKSGIKRMITGDIDEQSVAKVSRVDELTFKGSTCTRDCSGHEAGYNWYLRKVRIPNSHSKSFNKGADIAANEAVLVTDVPREEWLKDKIDYAKKRGRDSFGVPYMGSTTAYVRQPSHVMLPMSLLAHIPGARKEQQNIRPGDLDAIMKIMKDTGKLPVDDRGEEYMPFICVAWNGEPWVMEGNHRIMAAKKLGFDALPVELKYFDGGERVESGLLYPGKIGLKEPAPDTTIVVNEEPSNVTEAETGTAHARDISREFRKLGYSKIGSGADSTIWAKDDSHVIKILMPEDEGSQAVEVFKKFYEFCQKRPDIPCLPVFNEYNIIGVLDKEYIQIDMERLYPVKKNTLNEAMTWYLSDYVVKGIPWKQVKQELSDPHPWINSHWPRQANLLANQVKKLSGKKEASWHLLYSVMALLYKAGLINKLGWDLHTENVMQRSDGQLVIIDPWFADASFLTESVVEIALETAKSPEIP